MATGSSASFEITETNHKNIEDTLEIEKHLEDVITAENSETVFECKVDGHPQPICAWYKDGKLITSSQRTKITSKRKWHRLEIKNVNANDHGIYTIVCRNSSKQLSSKANLFVACRNLNDGVFYTHTNSIGAGVAKHLRNVKVEKGNRIELEATFQLDAIDDNYVWFKNNELIQQDYRTIILCSKKSTILTIFQSELTDSGVYYVVAKTRQSIVSSFTDVQVTAVKESMNNDQSILEELLPDEIEANEGEEIRMICKATIDINTSIKWHKNGELFAKKNFIFEDYGDHHIGLRGVKVSRTDTGEYSVIFRDEETGRSESSSCFVTVNPAPTKSPPVVDLIKPLESALACCGSKVTFDCSFALEDPTYFYVVWHVGHYRVERTSSRFSVVCKGGEFLLYIKRVEPGMSGEVVCELRKALPNQRTVHINCSSASLDIVPTCIVQGEKNANCLLKKGKLYNETVPREDMRIVVERNGISDAMADVSINGGGLIKDLIIKVILEITYCRLDDEGLFFLNSWKGHNEMNINLVVYKKQRDKCNTIVIEWDTTTMPCWYSINVGQNDGTFAQAGVSSAPFFEVEDPPVERIMRFRISTAQPASATSEYNVRIVPTPDTVLKPPKAHELRPMEEFEPNYTKTGDLIGCGAFGSVVLVRDGIGEYYAAKILKTRTQKKRDTAMREFETMKQLRHPKLVELMDAFVSKESFVLVMDYLWGGELFDRIVEEEHIKEVDVVPYVRQICEALQYLHTYKIAHLDLKPENIICLSPNSGQVKIIDFGLARVLEVGNITRAIYGTRDYVAPEVLNFERLTLACDMWSLGVVTYMLLSGVMPFPGDTWPERSANITLANYNYDETAFREISDLAKDFVDQLLVLVADKRMSATAALNHRWIKEGPPRGAKAGHMKRTRENLKSYLANYRARWQRAGNVMIAAHRLRTHAGSTRASAEKDLAACGT